jgi:hypothetical protein
MAETATASNAVTPPPAQETWDSLTDGDIESFVEGDAAPTDVEAEATADTTNAGTPGNAQPQAADADAAGDNANPQAKPDAAPQPPEMTDEWRAKVSALWAVINPAAPATAGDVAAGTAGAKVDPGGQPGATGQTANAQPAVTLDAIKPIDADKFVESLGLRKDEPEYEQVKALADQQNQLATFVREVLPSIANEVRAMREFYQQTQQYASSQQETFIQTEIDKIASQNDFWAHKIGKSWNDATPEQRANRERYAEPAARIMQANKWNVSKVGEAYMTALLADPANTRAASKAANKPRPVPRSQPGGAVTGKAKGGSVWDGLDSEFNV